ncbi:asparaginase [Polynucleobacter sp. es-GGE-1]|uniref:asparaginase n=1 Tax=Polynucleobacter sp. es-GGE-1 TaxID=1819724 RepID=UPI001C0AF33B|nr:asparaginase [Polynucleobacter sp. es-GGE-1]MBU3634596.1 asparaginase [Polynucleobacter sp. es-GGE-1]
MNSIRGNPENIPHILVLGVGGTIAGLAYDPANSTAYQSGQVGIETLLAKIQESIPDAVKIVSQQLANIDSRDLSEDLLTLIGNTVKESLQNPAVKGVVITHGTDTIEETGFFLHATCGRLAEKLGKRVVLVGAMLPANAPQADGPANLLDALKWTSTAPENCPGGVFAVFAGKVCLARDLAKRHSSALNAPLMDSPNSPIGLINPSWLSRLKAIQAASVEDLPIPEVWPWVDILTSHAGARGQTIEALVGAGVQGLVLAGTGLGGFHKTWLEPLKKAQMQGIALVRTSRTGAGATVASKDELSCELAGVLSAPRARIALQLALNAEKDHKANPKSLTWQDFFARIAVLPEFR